MWGCNVRGQTRRLGCKNEHLASETSPKKHIPEPESSEKETLLILHRSAIWQPFGRHHIPTSYPRTWASIKEQAEKSQVISWEKRGMSNTSARLKKTRKQEAITALHNRKVILKLCQKTYLWTALAHPFIPSFIQQPIIEWSSLNRFTMPIK